MSYSEHPRAMARYNHWFNQRLYAACATLDDAQRKEDRGAFFGSIHATLNHILLGDRLWMGRFTGEPFPVSGLDQELYADFAALSQAREQEDQRIIHWVEGLSEADLAATLCYESVVSPGPRTYPLWFAVSHFFNHQTHHRGQITTLLSQAGVDFGVTDLIWLPGYQLNG